MGTPRIARLIVLIEPGGHVAVRLQNKQPQLQKKKPQRTIDLITYLLQRLLTKSDGW
jgi:hypothetical protein